MAIKRLRYSTGQLLNEHDFRAEQQYHLDMRRRHNQWCHTSGVVYGLEVVPGTGKVTVRAGMAIDAKGRELVLEADQDLAITSSPAVVAIVQQETDTDPVSDAGFSGPSRITEATLLASVALADAVVLAKIQAHSPGIVFDVTYRAPHSGPAAKGDVVLGDADDDTVKIEGKLTTGHSSAKLQIGSPMETSSDLAVKGVVSVSGAGNGLSVTNNVYVGGRVGVGSAAPDSQLHLSGGNWDVGATEGDLKIGDATYRVKIGIARGGGGAGDVRIRAQGGTNRLLLGSGTADVLTVQNGKVGVGTTTPGEALEVKGNISLSGNLTLSGAIVQDDWIAPTLLNGWVNYGGGYNPAGYFRDKNGIVHLRGLVKMGTQTGAVASSTIFTLPLGFQPQYRELHAVSTNTTDIGRCDIDASGNVICLKGDKGWFSLDGITFRADPEAIRTFIGLAGTIQPLRIG